VLDAARLDYLRKLIPATAANISEACTDARLSRTTLYNHLKKYNLTVYRKKTDHE
jgi:transcriptional regulator of acetoin/glycerol metabolism